MDLTQYLQSGARPPGGGLDQSNAIEAVKAGMASTDPVQRQIAQQFLDRHGSLPFGVMANAATGGLADWLRTQTGVNAPGELEFARSLASETHPVQFGAANAIGALTPVGVLARYLRAAQPTKVESQPLPRPQPEIAPPSGPASPGGGVGSTEAIPVSGSSGTGSAQNMPPPTLQGAPRQAPQRPRPEETDQFGASDLPAFLRRAFGNEEATLTQGSRPLRHPHHSSRQPRGENGQFLEGRPSQRELDYNRFLDTGRVSPRLKK